MNATTLLRTRTEMPHHALDACHGGKHAIDWVGVLGGEEFETRGLRFLHDDILPPGSSIGVHRHEDDEEYYYILSGRGLVTLDGNEQTVYAGDVAAVFPGGSHGLLNIGTENLRVLVLSVPAPPAGAPRPER